jgi:hypothetical protein
MVKNNNRLGLPPINVSATSPLRTAECDDAMSPLPWAAAAASGDASMPAITEAKISGSTFFVQLISFRIPSDFGLYVRQLLVLQSRSFPISPHSPNQLHFLRPLKFIPKFFQICKRYRD